MQRIVIGGGGYHVLGRDIGSVPQTARPRYVFGREVRP
jgi:hypothetical protein